VFGDTALHVADHVERGWDVGDIDCVQADDDRHVSGDRELQR